MKAIICGILAASVLILATQARAQKPFADSLRVEQSHSVIPFSRISRNWQAYLGTLAVSEPEFFRLAGETQRASHAQGHRAIYTTAKWTGIICVVGGIVTWLTALVDGAGPDNDTIGRRVIFFGMAVDCAAVSWGKNAYSAEIARQVATDYNRTYNQTAP